MRREDNSNRFERAASADIRPQVSKSIKGPVKLVAPPIIIDGCGIEADLLIAFARIGCAQFVEAFEVVRMEDVSGGA